MRLYTRNDETFSLGCYCNNERRHGRSGKIKFIFFVRTQACMCRGMDEKQKGSSLLCFIEHYRKGKQEDLLML